MRARVVCWISCWGLVGTTGCGALTGIDDLVADRVVTSAAGGGSGMGGAGSGCASTCGTPGCGVCPGVAMIAVPSPAGDYRIDATEVTNADYEAFLAVSPTAALAPAATCAWNDSYATGALNQAVFEEAKAALAAEGKTLEDPRPACATWKRQESEPDRPVACVDWCDAVAYCTWAGKRLCGRVGTGAGYDITDGPTGTNHRDDAVSEWMGACDGPSDSAFPYGVSYEPGRCNDGMSGNDPVSANSGCVGGFAGLFDMSGNVGEWDAGCTDFDNPPELQNCLGRGGTWYQSGSDLQCDAFRDVPRFSVDAWLGFRCCAGP